MVRRADFTPSFTTRRRDARDDHGVLGVVHWRLRPLEITLGPLMIAAPDMCFPRINMATSTHFFSAAWVMLVSFLFPVARRRRVGLVFAAGDDDSNETARRSGYRHGAGSSRRAARRGEFHRDDNSTPPSGMTAGCDCGFVWAQFYRPLFCCWRSAVEAAGVCN